jgi:hypothetical protein
MKDKEILFRLSSWTGRGLASEILHNRVSRVMKIFNKCQCTMADAMFSSSNSNVKKSIQDDQK